MQRVVPWEKAAPGSRRSTVLERAAAAAFLAAFMIACPAPAPAAEDPGAAAQAAPDAAQPSGQQGGGAEQALDAAQNLIAAAQEAWMKGDEEKSIDDLDRAYASLLAAKGKNDSALAGEKADLRFTISKRLMEIYASRSVAAKGNHKAIPLTVNRYVEREIKLLQGRERSYFIASYRRSGRYRAEIVKALRDAGLPEELSWLPFIESGFKLRARSPARALGLWQFVPATAYKYGLRRNRWIDERLDPVKSTNAAIAYLSDLHEIFGDWATVLAAYNCGEGTVLRAISRQKKDYLDEFWDLYARLPYETARYFPRFLAVLAIVKDPARYGFTLDEPDAPAPYEEIAVDRPLALRTIAKKLGISGSDLADLNPELRRRMTPDRPYALKIPPGREGPLLAELAVLHERPAPRRAYVYHRVASGETLSRIALRYHASLKAIMQANDIAQGRRLRAGQRLKIPVDTIS